MSKSANTAEADNSSKKINSEEAQHNDVENVGTLETSIDTNFFYTNNKIINSFDDDEIIAFISNKYQNLNVINTDTIVKKEIVHFLEDEDFVEKVLKFYNISIFELFKIIYKQYGSIFKGPYLKKIRKLLSDKTYAKFK